MNLFSKGVKLFFCLSIAHIFYNSVSGQSLAFDAVRSVNLINQGIIQNEEQVKGYYFLYEKDSIDNSGNIFKFVITNENLFIINQQEIKLPDESVNLEISCNGSEIILMFFHKHNKTFEYIVYDTYGFQKFTYIQKLSGKEFRHYKEIAFYDTKEYERKSIYPLDTLGFLSNTLWKDNNKISYRINFYNSKKDEQWSFVPNEGGSYFYGDYLGTYKNIIYLSLFSFKEAIYTEKPQTYIIGLDVKTGKLLFKKSADAKYLLLAKEIKILKNGQGYLYGTYFNLKANLNKDKPDGIALWKLTDNGEIAEEKYISWENDFSKHIEITDKGKIFGVGYLNLHNIVQSANGEFYILAEGYHKVLNAYVIAKAVLFGLINSIGDNFTKDVASDMILIKLDTTCKIQGINIYDKKNSNYFCYNITQQNNTSNSFSFWYYADKFKSLKAINVSDSMITTNKIKVNPHTSKSIFLPAFAKHILLIEYFSNSKKMEMHFEKF